MLGTHLSDQEFEEIENSVCTIAQLTEVMEDYCEHNMDYEKIYQLSPVLCQIKSEIEKIVSKI